jgi:hypothetical protein
MKVKSIFFKSDEHNRSFGGKVKDFSDKDERTKEKKHLKAYLRGRFFYRHGLESFMVGEREMLKPMVHEVKEVWTPKTSTTI